MKSSKFDIAIQIIAGVMGWTIVGCAVVTAVLVIMRMLFEVAKRAVEF